MMFTPCLKSYEMLFTLKESFRKRVGMPYSGMKVNVILTFSPPVKTEVPYANNLGPDENKLGVLSGSKLFDIGH